ncbi:MAG TPA: XRE family transcriptional regulator [Microthrixaceae bacterium]|nr:XRE family transcriptional regulator [Microthrixaceae bacterium]
MSAERLVLARELHGWTQQRVVEELDRQVDRKISSPALSQFEKGRSRPSPETLADLAMVYGCPAEFFVERPGDVMRPAFFRSLKAAPARQRKRRMANARLLSNFVRVLEDYVVLPDDDIPDMAVNPADLDSVDDVAADLRAQWEVPAGPVDNVVRLLERRGAVVVRSRQHRADIDAFSVRFPERSIVVLGSDRDLASRSRFDAAHELGHLVMHGGVEAGTSAVERHAHKFAAAFLMPADEIVDHLPRKVHLPTLMDLKAEWRVSMQALLMRSRDLEAMSPDAYTNAMKMFSARGWRKHEPGDHLLGPVETPQLLDKALKVVKRVEGLDLEDLCAEGALPFGLVNDLLRRTRDVRPRVEL